MERKLWTLTALTLLALVLWAGTAMGGSAELDEFLEDTVRVLVYNAQPDMSGAEIVSGSGTVGSDDEVCVNTASTSESDDVITVTNTGSAEHNLHVDVPLGSGLHARVNLTIRNINVDMDVNRLILQSAQRDIVFAGLTFGTAAGSFFTAGAAAKTIMVVPRARVDFEYDYSVQYYLGNSPDGGGVVTAVSAEYTGVNIPIPIVPNYGIFGNLYAKIGIEAMGSISVEMGVRNNSLDVEYRLASGFEDHSRSGEAYASAAVVGQIDADVAVAFSISVLPQKLGRYIKVFEISYGVGSSADIELDLEQGTASKRRCVNGELETRLTLKAWAGACFKYNLSEHGDSEPGSAVDKAIAQRLDLSGLAHGEWANGAEWALDDLELTVSMDETSLGVNVTLWSRTVPEIRMGDKTVPLSGQVHYELTDSGWQYVENCTQNIRLLLDPQIEGEAPLVYNFYAGDKLGTAASWDYWPYKPGYVFTYWQDSDTGEDFYESVWYDTVVFWTGDKTLIAQYEPEERDPVHYGMDSDAVSPMMSSGTSTLSDGTRHYPINIHNRSDGQADALAYIAGHPDDGPWYGYPFYAYDGENSSISSVTFGSRIIGTTGMSGDANLTSVTASEGIRFLGRYTNCIKLPSIYFPDTVESTEGDQFRHCTSLSSVRLAPGITYIACNAFRECSSLRQIALPSGVDTIDDSAFRDSALESIVLPAGIGTIKDNAFRDCKNLVTVATDGTVPLWEIGDSAFEGCSSLRTVSIVSNDYLTLGMDLFRGTPSLQSIALTAKTISSDIWHAFAGSGAKELTVNAEWLDSFIVENANGLENLVITTGYLGALTIQDCNNLKTLEIHCTGMNTLLLGWQLGSLESVLIETDGRVEKIEISGRESCPCLTSLVVTGEIGDLELRGCYSLTHLEIGPVTGVLKMYNLIALEELTLSEGTGAVNANYIYNCVKLEKIVIPPNVEVLNEENSPVRFIRRVSSVSTAETFALRFESAFGTEHEEMRLPGGTEVFLPVPAREGFAFDGWYRSAALSQPLDDGLFMMPSEATTLWAAWTADAAGEGAEGNGATLTYSGDQALFSVPAQYTALAADSISPEVRTVFIPATVTAIEPGAFRSALALEVIITSSDNPVYYSENGILYTRSGALLAVPRLWRSTTLAVPDGVTEIAAHAIDYTEGACRVQTLLIPDSVSVVGENAFDGVSPVCSVFGPEQGAVGTAAAGAGLNYNVFMVYFVSDGEIVGVTSLSSGSPVPDLSFSADDRQFLGWSETEGGDPVADSYAIPYGGTVLYAVWSTDSVPIDAAHFPDAAFRAYVLENFDWDGNGSLSRDERDGASMVRVGVPDEWIEEGNCTPEEAAYIREHYQSRITTLQGIEYLTGLRWLHAAEMTALGSELDVSANTRLESVIVFESGLTHLTLGSLPSLDNVHCEDNRLSALDVTGCPALSDIHCMGNALTSLDLTHNPLLENLYCYNNSLSQIDLTGCPALRVLGIDQNLLTALDVSANTALTELSCENNRITALDLSHNTQLEFLQAGENRLAGLNVAGCTLLRELYVYSNSLTSLNVGANTALVRLECDRNALSSLDVSGLSSLRVLFCYSCGLESLDLEGCSSLVYLMCQDNRLTSLDITGCPRMRYLMCQINPISALDLSDNAELWGLTVYDTLLRVVDVSACPLLVSAVAPQYYTEDPDDERYAWYERVMDAENSYWITFNRGMLIKTDSHDYTVVKLPSSLTEIGSEAFAGIAADIVIVPEGCERIASLAFAQCPNLKTVWLPAGTSVAEDAFAGCGDVILARYD